MKSRCGWRDWPEPASVNVNIGIASETPEAEHERLEEKKRLARLMTQRERDQQLEMIRRLRERDRAQRAGERPAIEVQARRIEDKNRAGSNGAGGK